MKPHLCIARALFRLSFNLLKVYGSSQEQSVLRRFCVMHGVEGKVIFLLFKVGPLSSSATGTRTSTVQVFSNDVSRKDRQGKKILGD